MIISLDKYKATGGGSGGGGSTNNFMAELIADAKQTDKLKRKYNYKRISNTNNAYIIMQYSGMVWPYFNNGTDGAVPELTYNANDSFVENARNVEGNDLLTFFPICFVTKYLSRIGSTYRWDGLSEGYVKQGDSISERSYPTIGLVPYDGDYSINNLMMFKNSQLTLKTISNDYDVSYEDYNNNYWGSIYGYQQAILGDSGFGDLLSNVNLNNYVYTDTHDISLFSRFMGEITRIKKEFISLYDVKLSNINVNDEYSNTLYCHVSLPIDYDITFSRTVALDTRISFKRCKDIKTIKITDITNDTFSNSVYIEPSGCDNLRSIEFVSNKKLKYTGSLTKSLFDSCYSLTSIPEIDTSEATDMMRMFYEAKSLTTIPELDASNVTKIDYMFGGMYQYALTDFGGLKNLKVGNASFIKNCNNLTIESLMNIINKLAIVNNQTLGFGQTNLNKLTAEQIAVATAKGWTLTA